MELTVWTPKIKFSSHHYHRRVLLQFLISTLVQRAALEGSLGFLMWNWEAHATKYWLPEKRGFEKLPSSAAAQAHTQMHASADHNKVEANKSLRY